MCNCSSNPECSLKRKYLQCNTVYQTTIKTVDQEENKYTGITHTNYLLKCRYANSTTLQIYMGNQKESPRISWKRPSAYESNSKNCKLSLEKKSIISYISYYHIYYIYHIPNLTYLLNY